MDIPSLEEMAMLVPTTKPKRRPTEDEQWVRFLSSTIPEEAEEVEEEFSWLSMESYEG